MNNVVIGATGSIGNAFLKALLNKYPTSRFLACSRAPLDDSWYGELEASGVITWLPLELTEQRSIENAANFAATMGPLDNVIVATGLLHKLSNNQNPQSKMRPEKSLKELDAEWILQNFQMNSIGPALIMRYFLPLMNRHQRSIFALLSARVGSITDNKLGGWYSYRAAKAALNMLIKTAAVELKRSNPKALLVGLHPGTVDSALSMPFQKGITEGRLQTPSEAVKAMLAVLSSLSMEDSGYCFSYKGEKLPA
jgi:NAD(P)-dependent dehydrogenase (short-subunit alcohol dehydrogenase family)